MLRSGAMFVLFAGVVLGVLVPEEVLALEGVEDNTDIACGEHEGCHKMQHIVQHIVAEKERQLQEKDDQLQEQSRTLAFVKRLHSSVPPGANRALVEAATRTEVCMSEQPWDTTCDQKRSSELEGPAGREKFGEDSSAGGGDSVSYGSDAGAAARCSNVRANTATTGDLECVPDQCNCYTPDGFKTSCTECEEYWGGVVECPDGDIGWEGVYITGRAQYCAAWDSGAAKIGLQVCTADTKTCTKLAAQHLHKMSKSAGILVMKRMKCDDEVGCSVFKAGKCFDVGQDVFATHLNDWNPNLTDEAQQWASLVVAQLKAGTATVCGNTTTDHDIATAGILGY